VKIVKIVLDKTHHSTYYIYKRNAENPKKESDDMKNLKKFKPTEKRGPR